MKQKSGTKKIYKIVSLLLCFVFLLTGCGKHTSHDNIVVVKDKTDKQEQSEIAPLDEEKQDKQGQEKKENTGALSGSQELQDIEENQVEEGKDSPTKEELEKRRDEIGLSESNLSGLALEQSGNYYYEQCNSEEKLLYVELYQIMKMQEREILLSTKKPELLSRVYQCVINDHPELFYLNGYTYTQYTKKQEIQYITFAGRYLYSPEEVQARQKKIDAVIAENWNMLVGYDEYGTVKAVYEFLIFRTDYSTDSPDNQNICSVFLDRRSVCNGYAKAAQYLLNQMGIPCMIVNGDANGPHAWNIVEIDGAYYHMDVTWGDPSYHSDEENDSITPVIDYSYLCVTTEEICKNHRIDNAFPVPDCTSLNANYFVREGLYLTGYDEAQLRNIFNRAGGNSVVIKASDRQVYDLIYDNLITQQKIFDFYGSYQNGEYSIAYSGNPDLYTLHFWT